MDFSSAEDLDKALQMNGKKLMGVEVKLEKAKSKETMKENKKGTTQLRISKMLMYRYTSSDWSICCTRDLKKWCILGGLRKKCVSF